MTPTKTKSTSTTTTAHSPAPAAAAAAWRHSPSNITLLWMAISLPLVIWDTIYVLNRPLTMEGGWMHWPLWVPYQLYGEIDYVYGWPAVKNNDGFTSAQGLLNAIETAMYLAYLWVVFKRGDQGKRVVSGREGATAVLIGFSAAVMTLSKTVLYWANEYYSNFSNIGHNNAIDLIFLWIIPNGAWLVGSSIMIWEFSGNILDGLEAASDRSKQE